MSITLRASVNRTDFGLSLCFLWESWTRVARCWISGLSRVFTMTLACKSAHLSSFFATPSVVQTWSCHTLGVEFNACLGWFRPAAKRHCLRRSEVCGRNGVQNNKSFPQVCDDRSIGAFCQYLKCVSRLVVESSGRRASNMI